MAQRGYGLADMACFLTYMAHSKHIWPDSISMLVAHDFYCYKYNY